jgi:hypothetical protein
MDTTTRSTCRTLAGLLAPIFVGAATACFIFLAVLHAHDATWHGLGKAGRIFFAGLGIFATVATELLVLRQKKLIGHGQIVEAVVDDVRSLSWSKEHSAAYYHFFTQDRRVITSCCAIENDKKDQWSPGMKIMAIYDPARPARHVVKDRLWATQLKSAA